jgi:RNA-directed DNA polymerase
LQKQLSTGELQLGGYHYFKIYDPKERMICAAPFSQRVLHHAIMNVCHDVFESKQIYHSYATRPGKGTHAAVRYAADCTQKYRWFLKLDVKKFFDSIDHNHLKRNVFSLFKEDAVCQLFYQIIDSYEAFPDRGVPIGNLTSQYLSNHCLCGLDNYVLQDLKPKAYIRYMDDMLLFAADKSQLIVAAKTIKEYLKNEMQLQLKPICLNSTDRGVPFLGFLLTPQKILLAARSRQRFVAKYLEKCDLLDAGLLSQSQFGQQMLALSSFTSLADSKDFRNFVMLTAARQQP